MNWLIGLHALLGEIGAFSFFWILIDLVGPNSENSFIRARWAALMGTISLFLSWIVGGYYYLGNYQTLVKPVIKSGPYPWTHSVVTETKEHVFLLLPFLALYIYSLLHEESPQTMVLNEKGRLNIMMLAAAVFVMGLSMAAMGYLISSGFRSALEVKATSL
ncbi:MAG: hypothetical protein AB7T49_17725 [Oligoflexales bacterium]